MKPGEGFVAVIDISSASSSGSVSESISAFFQVVVGRVSIPDAFVGRVSIPDAFVGRVSIPDAFVGRVSIPDIIVGTPFRA